MMQPSRALPRRFFELVRPAARVRQSPAFKDCGIFGLRLIREQDDDLTFHVDTLIVVPFLGFRIRCRGRQKPRPRRRPPPAAGGALRRRIRPATVKLRLPFGLIRMTVVDDGSVTTPFIGNILKVGAILAGGLTP